MAIFKTNRDIFTAPWEDELFNENWMDHDVPYAPPTVNWKYDREMRVEDVEIWEQICYKSGGIGLYAAYLPYAEFYIVTGKWIQAKPSNVECFYGPGSMQAAYRRAKELGLIVAVQKTWVDDKDLWLHQPGGAKQQGNIILSD
jgi:hypothetical protein